jgi:hypothetical protein
LALLPLLLVLLLAAAVAAGASAVRRSPPSPESTVGAARLHARFTAAAAVVLAAAAAVGTAVLGSLRESAAGRPGVTVLLTVTAFGVAHTGVLLLGELTWPRPLGEVRRARLVRRGPWDSAPVWLLRLAAAAATAAVVTLLLGAYAGSPDGRSVTFHDGVGVGARTSSASPFPGAFYGVPAGIGLLVLAAVTVAALVAVANRPAVVTTDDRVETALRRASAHRVLRGAVGPALVVVGGLLLTGGRAVAVAGAGPLAGLGIAVAVLGGIAAIGGIVVTGLPAPRIPVDAPLVPAG